MAKITAVDENVKVEDATVEETVTPVEDVVVEPEETIDSDFSVDNTEESYDEDVMPLPSGEEDATPVYNGDVAQQSSETIGKKWNEYTTGTDLDDTDELMILDTSAKANKRTLLSKLSDYVLGKLADKVFEKLETQNKTILGALNELNSNQATTVTSVKTSILKSEITLLKAGNVVVISYTGDTTDNVKRGDLQVIGAIPPDYVPRQRFVIAPIQSTAQRIQLTIEKSGNIIAYNYGNEITTQTPCRYNGCYVC